MPNVAEEFPQTESDASSRPAPRKNTRVKFVLLLFLLIAIGAGTALYLHFQNRVSSDDANVDGHISSVAPKISGNVIEVLVNDNQQVKAGEVLVRIDPRDYQAKVDMAKASLLQAENQAHAATVTVPLTAETTQSGVSSASAQLANAEAELERARAAYEQASGSDLKYAQANVESKKASNDRAQTDLARMTPLVEKAEISRQQYDSFVAAAKVAKSELQAALKSARTRVSQAQAQLGSSVANQRQVPIRKADVGSASAAVKVARANLDVAELQLSYTTITAPVDGRVTRKSVEVGQVVSPGQSILALIPLRDVWVTANFKETQLAHVRAGQKAEINVDMYGKTVTGHVDSIAAATGSRLSLLPPENATGNFVKVVQRIPVKILVDDPNNLVLRVGMNVDVTIFTR
jgi:membrane fusion protein (multidrug efflux system)